MLLYLSGTSYRHIIRAHVGKLWADWTSFLTWNVLSTSASASQRGFFFLMMWVENLENPLSWSLFKGNISVGAVDPDVDLCTRSASCKRLCWHVVNSTCLERRWNVLLKATREMASKHRVGRTTTGLATSHLFTKLVYTGRMDSWSLTIPAQVHSTVVSAACVYVAICRIYHACILQSEV